MKKLENLIKLSSKVTLIVPSTVDVNKEVDNTPQIELVASSFSEWFGGATASDTLGFWKSPSYGLVREKSTTVFAYCSQDDLTKNIENVIKLAEKIKEDMSQEAVALEINGEMYFI